ncbi:hemerythrin domain-containing protein [Sphingobacterium sp. SGG-5]|uniref:hemerythrin domain-containing protein n=1 Tax=Sphingobacterium sp. SGG-5 TaxID=2710881 RepID=UPI0013EDE5FB|nr:hemerythrin domain-containing protein [Sphingobacterium sp. SGG-5]NGM60985.1 hemerythrin domain-containing protein [Sphingobacterium sp. SGG-5]
MKTRQDGLLYDFFTADHRRIETIFAEATQDINNVDLEKYHEFRIGLLTHIKMEEKVLFVAAQKANGGEPLPLQAKLRLDHGALTALLVCVPSPEVIKVIDYIMEQHDILEEEQGGMYEACEKLTQQETEQIMGDLKAITPVPVHPFNEAPYVLEVAKRCMNRAGFDFDTI